MDAQKNPFSFLMRVIFRKLLQVLVISTKLNFSLLITPFTKEANLAFPLSLQLMSLIFYLVFPLQLLFNLSKQYYEVPNFTITHPFFIINSFPDFLIFNYFIETDFVDKDLPCMFLTCYCCSAVSFY